MEEASMHRRKHSVLLARALKVAAIAAVPLLLLACPIGVDPVDEPDDTVEEGTFLDLVIDAPPASRLISVHEYAVTSLEVQVSDPDGEVIQKITWLASEGSKRYRIPVEQQGKHGIIVTHIATEENQVVTATESATFYIQAMTITVIDIIPGFIGYINIDGSAREAIRAVREDLLPVVLRDTGTKEFVLRRLDGYLPAGTLITEDSGLQAGARAVSRGLTLEEDSYLFFLDLHPGMYFEHDVRYLIVSRSGKTRTVEARWWPRVNDEVPEAFVAEVPEAKYVIERNVALLPSDLTVKQWVTLGPGVLQMIKKEAYIVVQGLMSTENLYSCSVTTYNNVYNFFDAYRGSFSTMVGLHDSTADNVLTEVDELVEDGYDIITIYIIAHGSTDSVRLGGYHVYASEFAATMSSHAGVQFNFLLGSCHSGSFVDDLQAVGNVRVVETACSTTQGAYPDYDNYGGLTDPNPSDSGSEWTSSLFEAAGIIVNNATLWDYIVDRASDNGVPKTSVLLNEAGYLGQGLNRGLGTTLTNYDLTNRLGWSTAQHYNSWESLE
jgi:hypothetical protein